MADNLSEISLDFTVKEQYNIPYEFVEYCEGAVLMLKDKDTIALYSAKEFEKLMKKARSTGNNAIMRYLFGSTVEVGSFENLPDALSEYVAHFWNYHNPWPVLELENGVYILHKGNFNNFRFSCD